MKELITGNKGLHLRFTYELVDYWDIGDGTFDVSTWRGYSPPGIQSSTNVGVAVYSVDAINTSLAVDIK